MVIEHRLLELHLVVESALILCVNWAPNNRRLIEVRLVILALSAPAMSGTLEPCRKARAILFKTFCFCAFAWFSLCLGTDSLHTHWTTFENAATLLLRGLFLLHICLFYVRLTDAASFEIVDLHGRSIRKVLIVNHFLKDV